MYMLLKGVSLILYVHVLMKCARTLSLRLHVVKGCLPQYVHVHVCIIHVKGVLHFVYCVCVCNCNRIQCRYTCSCYEWCPPLMPIAYIIHNAEAVQCMCVCVCVSTINAVSSMLSLHTQVSLVTPVSLVR